MCQTAHQGNDGRLAHTNECTATSSTALTQSTNTPRNLLVSRLGSHAVHESDSLNNKTRNDERLPAGCFDALCSQFGHIASKKSLPALLLWFVTSSLVALHPQRMPFSS
jgi:hypothetical protein